MDTFKDGLVIRSLSRPYNDRRVRFDGAETEDEHALMGGPAPLRWRSWSRGHWEDGTLVIEERGQRLENGRVVDIGSVVRRVRVPGDGDTLLIECATGKRGTVVTSTYRRFVSAQ